MDNDHIIIIFDLQSFDNIIHNNSDAAIKVSNGSNGSYVCQSSEGNILEKYNNYVYSELEKYNNMLCMFDTDIVQYKQKLIEQIFERKYTMEQFLNEFIGKNYKFSIKFDKFVITDVEYDSIFNNRTVNSKCIHTSYIKRIKHDKKENFEVQFNEEKTEIDEIEFIKKSLK